MLGGDNIFQNPLFQDQNQEEDQQFQEEDQAMEKNQNPPLNGAT